MLSRAERELIDRAASLATRLSAADASYIAGQPTLGSTDYATLSNSLTRTLTVLGLKRRQRNVTSLGEVLRAGAHG